MESTHTPGPWTRRHPEFYQLAESRWQVRGSDGELIATIEKRPKGLKDRGDANGDLISAAPDLLKACELAEATIRRLAPVHAGGFSSANGTLDVILAAIAKAKGEA